MRRPLEPRANGSPEAIALRRAAMDWSTCEDPPDYDDRIHQRLNRQLLLAAVKYAKAASRSPSEDKEPTR